MGLKLTLFNFFLSLIGGNLNQNFDQSTIGKNGAKFIPNYFDPRDLTSFEHFTGSKIIPPGTVSNGFKAFSMTD